jgi:predicted Zn-dependent protease
MSSRPNLWQRAGCALIALSVAAAGVPVRAQVRLPSLGESASDDLTVAAEKRLGEQIMREIRRDPDYLDDPVLLDYLQSIWNPLVSAARQRGDLSADIGAAFAWEAFLVRDRSVNAFALPGGFVGVHLALIALTGSGDELASVLAHELSHVTQRHIARSITNSQRQGLLAMAGLILGILAAGRSHSPDAAQAAVIGSQAASVQGQLNFSRDMEREADRIGFAVLDQAGFEPAGMALMFEKLDQANRLNDSGSYPYLRSHPLTTERIAEARVRAGATVPGALLRSRRAGACRNSIWKARLPPRASGPLRCTPVQWRRWCCATLRAPSRRLHRASEWSSPWGPALNPVRCVRWPCLASSWPWQKAKSSWQRGVWLHSPRTALRDRTCFCRPRSRWPATIPIC